MQNVLNITKNNVEFFGVYTLELHLLFVVGFVAAATISDIRHHKIPNRLVATGICVALVYHTFSLFGQGVIFSCAGLATGICALMPFYVLRTMGAGDIKLMGMIGAYVGTSAVVNIVLATMVAGGGIALITTAYRRMLPQLVANLRDMIIQRHLHHLGFSAGDLGTMSQSVGKMPYAIAIAAGTACHIFWLRTN